MTTNVSEISALSGTMRGDEMLQPEEVAAMVQLHGLGWGAKRLSQEFGCSRNTVRRYLRTGGPVAYRQPDADSDDRAHVFRSDAAQRSDLIARR